MIEEEVATTDNSPKVRCFDELSDIAHLFQVSKVDPVDSSRSS